MAAALGFTWRPASKAFGSFQSEDPEQLIRVADADYCAPPRLPAPQRPPDDAAFGHAARAAHFLLDPSWTFVNHGAFGASCRPALEAARAWAAHAELQPLRYIDRELFPLLCHSLRRAAALVHAPPTSLALVPNATYALSSVIASVVGPMRGGSVCMLDIGYGSVQKMLRHACGEDDRDGTAAGDGTCGVSESCGPPGSAEAGSARAEVRVLHVRLPCSRDELVSQVLAKLPADASLLVLDQVTSNTGIVMPVAEIVAGVRVRAPRCIVLVDGAHSLGQLDLDLSALDCDYFVGNFHKWLCSARGLGLLYARTPELAARVRAAVISHGFGNGFTSEYLWDGCRDYSMAVALPELLDWWSAGDRLARARTYCRALLVEAVALLVAAWGTRPHMAADCYANMACVELPAACLPPGALAPDGSGRPRCSSTHGKMLQDALHFAFRVECPVKVLDSRCYVRISAQIHNERADFEALAAAVLRIKWRALEGGAFELAM